MSAVLIAIEQKAAAYSTAAVLHRYLLEQSSHEMSTDTSSTVRNSPSSQMSALAKCQTDFTWPDSEQFPVKIQAADNTPQTISTSINTSQPVPYAQATLFTRRVVLAPTLTTPDRGSILMAVQAAPKFTDPCHKLVAKQRQRLQIASLLSRLRTWRGGCYGSSHNLMAKLLQWNIRAHCVACRLTGKT